MTMGRLRGARAAAPVVVALFLVLQACGAAATPTAAPAAQATTAPAAAAKEPTKPAGAEVLVPTAVPTKPAAAAAPTAPAKAAASSLNLPVPREQTFIMPTGPTVAITITDSFNYFHPRGIQPGWNVQGVMYEALLYHNIEGTSPDKQWVAGLAEKWEYCPDYMCWKATLRDGIKWNDGTPFTSEDVRFTVDTMLKNPQLGRRDSIAGIKSVEAPDPKTVVFNFPQKNPRFQTQFASRVGGLIVLPKHKWVDQDPLTYKNNPPVATGPYKLYSVLPDQKMIIFERDDNYWGKAVFGLPKPKYVAIVSPPPADLLAEGYKTGVFDYGGSLTYDAAKKMADESGGNAFVLPFLDMCPRGLLFNHALAPTDKVEVRKALANMIDRKGAAAALWKPPSRVTSRPWYGGSTMLNFASQELVTKYDNEYTGDQKKALEWFQKAGYTQQGGKMVDSAGQQLKIDVYTPVAPTSAENPIAVKLVEDLKKMGIDASFKFEEGAPAAERRQKGEWNVQSMWQCGGNLGDAALLYQQLMSDKTSAPVGQLEQGTNWVRYKNPKFDELTTRLLALPADDPEAKKLYDELYTIWMEDMISLPLMETIYTQVGNTLYWTNFPQQPDMYAHPASWHMTLLNIIRNLQPGKLGKA